MTCRHLKLPTDSAEEPRIQDGSGHRTVTVWEILYQRFGAGMCGIGLQYPTVDWSEWIDRAAVANPPSGEAATDTHGDAGVDVLGGTHNPYWTPN